MKQLQSAVICCIRIKVHNPEAGIYVATEFTEKPRKLKVPTGPGMGVNLDPEWIEKHEIVKL
jgi:L-alanine-DL-glutamate epimerase-like enolase superfamily enzyme